MNKENNRIVKTIVFLFLFLFLYNGTVFGTASPYGPIYEVNVSLSTDSFNPGKNEACNIAATIRKLDYWLWGGPIPAGYDVVSYIWGISIVQAEEPYNTYEVLSGSGLSVTSIPYPFVSFNWDGKDENGNNVPVGDYYMYIWVNATYTPETYALPGVAVTKTINVQSLTLKRVEVYYRHQLGNSLPIAGYPTTTTPITIRAIVWAHDGTSEKPYTLQNQDEEINDGKWYNAGSEGSQAYSYPPNLNVPVLEVSNAPKIYKWHSNWPQLDFEWKDLVYRASRAINTVNCTIHTPRCAGKNRNNWHDEYSSLYLSSWGGDNIMFPLGDWRFKVKAIINKGAPEEQFVVSSDTECATRVSVLSSNAPVDPNGKEYLKWLTAYYDVPYEWGGYWFGGKEDKTVGGHNTYEGYGIDCSGIVSICAKLAGYNWSPDWRANTSKLAYGPDGKTYDPLDPNSKPADADDDYYYSILIAAKDLKPGDILNKSANHVVTVYRINSKDIDGNPKVITIISAEAKTINRVVIQVKEFYRYNDYEPRRLVAH